MLYDLTVTLRAGMPTYDGEPGPTRALLKIFERDGVNVSVVSLGAHTGTHVDAPVHFLPGREGVDQLPLPAMLGPCWVVEVRGQGHVDARDLEAAGVPSDAERVILNTGNSRFWDDDHFHRDFRALTTAAARWLVARGVRLIGIDYLSIDPYEAREAPAHQVLLGAGVVVLEGLDLRGVPAGRYELVCLPLKLQGSDGAPARAVLIG